MRREFGRTILELAKEDSKIYLIVSDLGYGLFDKFRVNFPNRFLNLGISEQSIISIAAGMALEGLKPYVYTITPFLIERPFEQIKLDVDQQKTNVKLVGYADYPNQGPTHSELNGKTLMGLLKNTSCFFPSDSQETREALISSYRSEKPTFISLKKDPLFK